MFVDYVLVVELPDGEEVVLILMEDKASSVHSSEWKG